MHLPRNDIEQIRYNAKYNIGGSVAELGKISVHALAKDLSKLSDQINSLSNTVSSMRSGVRRGFSRQTQLIQDQKTLIQDQTTLIRDRFDLHRAELVSDLTAALNNKMSELREFLASQRPAPVPSPGTMETPLPSEQETIAFQQPRMGHNTPFSELRSAILGTTPVFRVSMPKRVREDYGAYISTLKKENGIDYHYLDASRLPRDRFRSARTYMPGVVRSSSLWCNV